MNKLGSIFTQLKNEATKTTQKETDARYSVENGENYMNVHFYCYGLITQSKDLSIKEGFLDDDETIPAIVVTVIDNGGSGAYATHLVDQYVIVENKPKKTEYVQHPNLEKKAKIHKSPKKALEEISIF